MTYLVDTNVVSELRKKRRCDSNVAAWQSGVHLDKLFISAVSMLEIRRGVLAAQRKDPEFSSLLAEWYENQIKPTFEHRVIAVDLAIAEQTAAILTQRTRSLADALIAATAHVHGLTLVTRNVSDFEDIGIKILNPWETSDS